MLGVLTMPENLFKKQGSGSSLVVHWLRFCASTAGGMGSVLGWGTKIPHTKPFSQKNKKRKPGQQILSGVEEGFVSEDREGAEEGREARVLCFPFC